MSRYLVTGATGFLGRHLVAQLRADGHSVVALCRRPEPSLAASSGSPSEGPAEVRLGDVLDAASVREAAAGCDGLFHCAGKVSRDPADAEALHRVHVEGTQVTLDAARAAGVPRAVIASTSGVVAVSREPSEVRSEEAEAPMEILAGLPYYRSKLYAERAAMDRSGPGFEVLAVNPTLLLGPGDLRGSSTEDVVKLLERRVPFVPAGGLSFVDARDAAAGMRLAMAKGRAGRRYLLSAVNLTIEAFFARLARLAEIPLPRLRAPRSVLLARAGAELFERAARAFSFESPLDRTSAEMAQYFWYVDATRARAELGWAPRDPTETLSDTVADLRARGVVWPRA